MTVPLGVVICTHNPDRALLGRVLAALEPQLGPDVDFLLVDNASSPPVSPELVTRLGGRIVAEPRVGLAHARAAGIAASRGDVLVFVDDDNILGEGYLAHARRIADAHPDLGAFAGRAIGRFGKPPSWLHRRHIARYAVRDLGDAPLHGTGAQWEIWEPFGAGLVVRRDVAEAFAALHNTLGEGIPLGRAGARLGSGEDSLFSRIADRLGYEVGYRPELVLEHVIPARRLTLGYLLKLVEGQGRSHAALEAACGRLVAQPKSRAFPSVLMRRFVSRLRDPGLHEAITHIWWDLGFFQECERLSTEEHQLKLECVRTSQRFGLEKKLTSRSPELQTVLTDEEGRVQ